MADAGNARNRRMAMGWEMAASMALGALIASALYQNVIPLRGSLGDWLFWPERHVPALGRLWPSMVVHRIVFASVTLVLTLPIIALFRARRPEVRRRVPGLIRGLIPAVAPMMCWAISASLDLLALLGLLFTVALVWCLSLFPRSAPRPGRLAWYGMLLLWFGWWMLLFRDRLDPIMLLVPVPSAIALFIWTQWTLTAETDGTYRRQRVGTPFDPPTAS